MTQKQDIREYHASLKLGDKLEWLFKWTGIKWIVKKIYPNSNCERRKDYLNEIKVKRK